MYIYIRGYLELSEISVEIYIRRYIIILEFVKDELKYDI